MVIYIAIIFDSLDNFGNDSNGATTGQPTTRQEEHFSVFVV